ncbi:MAG TPA: T9SS type A sorting domain-containing protein [candidate division WOR-3 bacterium]|uniref:T9SS type A sorting domain-containing protein n=1 Tax=candidate division WOR-3 bacterium TaxID=2052148 RepID=A0A9C9ELN7_UNCW3|nr:T9SS type A sorting domain-containing protein [candidate division WOR-3 bacterium]
MLKYNFLLLLFITIIVTSLDMGLYGLDAHLDPTDGEFQRHSLEELPPSIRPFSFDTKNPSTKGDSLKCTLVGGWFRGPSHTLKVVDSLAYIGDGRYFKIINVKNPSSPELLGTITTASFVWNVYVSGNYAYIANDGDGLMIIDVSDPQNPFEAAFFHTSTPTYYSTVTCVHVSGNYAYLANGWDGLRILDVSDPENPWQVGICNTPGFAEGVYVSGNYAYVADWWNGLRIINVSNPANPSEVGYYDTESYANRVCVSGSYAYVADYNDGIRIIDVSNPAGPWEIGYYDTGQEAYDVFVKNNYAYVADRRDGLRIINVSNPANPSEVGYYDTNDYAVAVHVTDNYAYVADYSDGLRIINVSNPANPSEVGYYDTGGLSIDVCVSDNYLYVAAFTDGLRIIDVSDPAHPVEIGHLDTGNETNGVFVSGNYAYLADDWGGLRIINVSDPASPWETGIYNAGWLANDVYVSDIYAYVAEGFGNIGGLRIIDISNPANPWEVGYCATSEAYGVYVAGNYAYVADYWKGLRIIDISNPTSPFEVGQYDTDGYAKDVYIKGNYAYVADGSCGLRNIDVSDPANPFEVGFYMPPLSTPKGIYISGDYAYIANWSEGLRVVEISNPAIPIETGYYDTGDYAEGICVSDGYVYVADYNDGVYIIRYDTSGIADISTTPNGLIFDYSTKKSEGLSCPSEYQIANSRIDEQLLDRIRKSPKQELIPILIKMSEQLNSDVLSVRATGLAKQERREWVSAQLKSLAQQTQKALLLYLESEKQRGNAKDVRSLWIVNAVSVKATKDVINRLSVMPGVSQISYDGNYFHILGKPGSYSGKRPADPDRAIVWGVQKIRADQVWPLGYTGDGIIIGNIDTGVNYNHTDLADHMWNGGALYPHHGWDFVNKDNDPMDDNGHGTHTAGTVAGDGTSGTQTGVAPDAQIMALKVLNASGSGNFSDMADAIQFAIIHGADAISMSIGAEDPSNSTKDYCRNMCNNAFAADLPMAVAAGNGISGSPGSHYNVPHDISTPGDVPAPWYGSAGHSAVLTVGATNSSNVVANFSSYGPTEWNTETYHDYSYPPGLMKPDVSAPGVNVISLMHNDNSGYTIGWDGTSMATPHLAGTIALMLEKNPLLTCKEIDSIISNFGVVDLGNPGRDSLYGAGRIDAYDAVVATPATSARKGTFYTLNAPSATLHLSVSSITWSASWIKDVSPTAAAIGIGDSTAIDVYVDSVGIPAPGTYWDTLWIYSNDPDENPYPEPICLITGIVGIEEEKKTMQLPATNHMCLIGPNPFKSATKISYTVAKASNVKVEVYNVLGQQIKTLVNKKLTPGYYETIWYSKDDRGRRVPAGVYFMQLTVNDENLTKKLILTR